MNPTGTGLPQRALRLGLALAGLLLPFTAAAGQVTHHSFHSEILGRSYSYNLYLPEGYRESSARYPVVYLLHGSFGDEHSWVNQGRVRAIVDYLIRTEQIPPAVIVMPGSRSWWIDGHNEPARSAFFGDLLPHIEQTWRVVPHRSHRAVAGLSAGGFGAINFALQEPGQFAAAAALSPATYTPYPPRNSTSRRHPAFTDENGEFDPELWESTLYTAHLADYQAQDQVVPFYISSGDRDVFEIADYAETLHDRLQVHQPGTVRYQLFPGGHTWQVWRRSLPHALRFLFQHTGGPVPCSAHQTPDGTTGCPEQAAR